MDLIRDEVRPDVKEEWERWLGILDAQNDPYLQRFTIGLQEVLRSHFLLVDYFFKVKEGIGGVGPKSADLLHSALGRQFTTFGRKDKWSKPLDICATLFFGLIKNHPFHDANKRTAFLTCLLHLQKIGRTPTVDSKIFEDFTVDVAQNKLICATNVDHGKMADPDKAVGQISSFLRRHTRDIDLTFKQITYNDLNKIIGNYGLMLANPKGNRIDVVQFFHNGISKMPGNRIIKIGFHGWTKQVSRKDIHLVRSAAHLDPRHGYDSQSFFNGVETPLELIKKYEEPLQNLAFR